MTAHAPTFAQPSPKAWARISPASPFNDRVLNNYSLGIPISSYNLMANVKAFINGQICFHGQALNQTVYVDKQTGLIISQPAQMPSDFVDLNGALLAPAYLELQTNGCVGTHFTNFKDPQSYRESLRKVSRHLVRQGVGAFYATLPTVQREVFAKVMDLYTSSCFAKCTCHTFGLTVAVSA